MESTDAHRNRLANESSPYLLQHADNPVEWYPWGEEAFQKARKEDKPVLVSIGYATCHWCHVMAHESFEDEQVASLMNRAFVNIKVDREERPDIDNTYMLVCQMLTGSGGWPLNVFLTPDKKPFYAATYIPKQGRHGRPGMLELVPRILELWENEREKITSSTDQITEAFQKSTAFKKGQSLSAEDLKQAYSQYQQQFDETHGGFGTAPKFPSPHNLMFLLRYAYRTENSDASEIVEYTLTKMRYGGIFDHIGFGFHRYSTDGEWLLPHFEKMLYDQAMLLMAYAEGWKTTGRNLFKQTVHEIADYLDRKMQHPEGGFYSAEDADSEGEEGKFYIWSVKKVRDLLKPAEAELAIEVFNLSEEGNYYDEATGQRTGNNIPHRTKPIRILAEERNMSEEKLTELLEDIRRQLLDRRQQRVYPLLDDKILTDWNGLIIAALAKAARILNNNTYQEKAYVCLEFINNHLWVDNTLKHRHRKGETAIDAHADDYAFLIWGLLELYQTSLDPQILQQAISLQETFNEGFWDKEEGGFYFTHHSAEELLGRKKEIYDGALPSANSVGMLNLLRLGRITGKTEWEQMAEQMNTLFAGDIRGSLTNFGFTLQAVEFVEGAGHEIIIVGPRSHERTQAMIQSIQSRYLPNAILILKEPEDTVIPSLASYTSDFAMIDGKPTAYVCSNYTCEQPTTDVEVLNRLLK